MQHTGLIPLTTAQHIEDAAGNPITETTPLDTPLFEADQGQPILAPDGHQVTLGEWLAVSGSMAVKCTEGATHTVLHLSGLIPYGVYTVWFFKFAAPAQLSGVGAFPASNAQGNIVTASQAGIGSLSLRSPAGNLSILGSITDCWLADEFEVHVVLAYHIDGQTYGPVPGPSDTTAFQAIFFFREGAPFVP